MVKILGFLYNVVEYGRSSFVANFQLFDLWSFNNEQGQGPYELSKRGCDEPNSKDTMLMENMCIQQYEYRDTSWGVELNCTA